MKSVHVSGALSFAALCLINVPFSCIFIRILKLHILPTSALSSVFAGSCQAASLSSTLHQSDVWGSLYISWEAKPVANKVHKC